VRGDREESEGGMKTSSRIKRIERFLNGPLRDWITPRRNEKLNAVYPPGVMFGSGALRLYRSRLERRNSLYLAELRWVCRLALAHYSPNEDG
jgi:hypothetical protein